METSDLKKFVSVLFGIKLMRFVIQRIKSARLSVDGQLISEVGAGLMVFVGVMRDDTIEQVRHGAKKIATLRIFRRDGKLNESVLDTKGEILLVSNFTLCTREGSGARPDFSMSADKEKANDLYHRLADELDSLGVPVKMGVFGADMQIDAHIDGPLNIYKEIK